MKVRYKSYVGIVDSFTNNVRFVSFIDYIRNEIKCVEGEYAIDFPHKEAVDICSDLHKNGFNSIVIKVPNGIRYKNIK